MKEIEQAWGLPIPKDFSSIYDVGDFDSFRRGDEETVWLPSPLLTPEEIVEQAALKDEWQIPEGMVPFMGDMHDLACLDLSTKSAGVVLLNDQRERNRITDTFEEFISGIQLTDQAVGDNDGIIEEESWLDF
ncbi:SMI1/KNR4 family protein [Pelagicoccus mobilis]|uniref:SMI1/KNR4 family protein n=1 Tax=Pelagicoccus mobilis TaxID=415221 RepID=A0A934VP43_9BACT|nr:SMI1/KNR4 family protein [Pelagicoccus mobilis]MBK1880611.1 SMI1/KNR4 family protein [Pelagicoccus mobilis]